MIEWFGEAVPYPASGGAGYYPVRWSGGYYGRFNYWGPAERDRLPAILHRVQLGETTMDKTGWRVTCCTAPGVRTDVFRGAAYDGVHAIALAKMHQQSAGNDHFTAYTAHNELAPAESVREESVVDQVAARLAAPLERGRSCASCRYWDRHTNPEDGAGFCRLNPPTYTGPAWPVTEARDWCGQYTPPADDHRTTDETRGVLLGLADACSRALYPDAVGGVPLDVFKTYLANVRRFLDETPGDRRVPWRPSPEDAVKKSEVAEAVEQAELALGENLVWLTDQLDLKVRQGDEETLRRLLQLTSAWERLARVLPTLGVPR